MEQRLHSTRKEVTLGMGAGAFMTSVAGRKGRNLPLVLIMGSCVWLCFFMMVYVPACLGLDHAVERTGRDVVVNSTGFERWVQ